MRTRAVRPDKLDFEYELNISRSHDDILKKDFILFEFRTKKIFENFAYRINVIPKINTEKKELEFNIEGLSAPRLDISKAGHAVYEYKFFEFKSIEYDLKLMKYNKSKTLFKFKITPKNIKLTLDPPKKFIKVYTEGN
ncbi:MAG TPA: hypothetical protein PKA90_02055 [Ignavibacteria bacterium]|nr:hypothetical protein [Ignavibacteria bacterium]HMR39191.1 hypothetical protein [Ignavibacteria bacterium]